VNRLSRSTRRNLLLLVTVALCAVPSVASAGTPPVPSIGSGPLKVYSDLNGSIQVNVDGRELNEFFPQSSQTDNAGFGLAVDPGGSTEQIWGAFGGTRFPDAVSGPTVQAGPPATITTEWDLPDVAVGAGPRFHVKQVLTYNNGERDFDSAFTVTNTSGSLVNVRAFVAGDLAIRGSDVGVGISRPGPPLFIGGLNQTVGGTGGFTQETQWSHFQSGSLSDVSTAVRDRGFNDVISPDETDNAAGVEWDRAMSPGKPETFSVGWRFTNTLGLTPTTDTQTTGNDEKLTASLGDLDGKPLGANKKVVWQVTGANSTLNPVTTETGKNGRAEYSYVGGNPGEDAVTAFVDNNGNGTYQSSEPQAVANITWKGPEAPQQGQSVNVRPQSGKVLIKLPSGAAGARAAKRIGVSPVTAAKRFVRLKANTQIPLGAILDTTKGKVRLLSAGKPTKSTGGSIFQGGSFNGSQFLISQRNGGSGTTELSTRGGKLRKCSTRLPKGGSAKVVASRRRSRSLFGRAHGRFRTRGRNSSATVRGTSWKMTDTCAGTLTKVFSGRVTVRDFRTGKVRTLRKGQKYLARALKRRH
jgi:hypothetical protein